MGLLDAKGRPIKTESEDDRKLALLDIIVQTAGFIAKIDKQKPQTVLRAIANALDKSEPRPNYSCPNCGGEMIGDDYTMASHCENAELPKGAEADSGPWYCEEAEDESIR